MILWRINLPFGQRIDMEIQGVEIVKGRKKKEAEAINISASFDIETSSFYFNPKTGKTISIDDFYKIEDTKKAKDYEKRGCLVAWGFGLLDDVIFGRSWKDFLYLLEQLQRDFKLDPFLRILPVYIHNLSYEFQWFRKRLDWVSVFATAERQPIRALCSYGIEFRDSLILSGYSLEKTAENLLNHKIDKLIGSWDYRALRGEKTPLTSLEWDYLKNDNMILLYYLDELKGRFGNINKIPMTKTGIVREDVRNYVFWENRSSHKRDNNKRFLEYRRLMKQLTFDGEREYRLCKLGFAGGFTHSNSMNVSLVLYNVASKDLTSSYPTIICSEYFPMSKGKRVRPKDRKEFKEYLNAYSCLFEIELWNVESTFPWEHIISRSKCIECEEGIVDNGRLIRANHIRIVITEIDYKCYEKFYSWKKESIREMYIYIKGYLPKAIIEKTLQYYKDKTELKGVEGKEAEYQSAKANINSIFGMMVYDPLKDDIVYKEEEWGTDKKDIEEEIEKYNNSVSRFLSYQWGIWITAYGRRNILSAILHTKEDHVYTDTDSEKYLNPEKHEAFFRWYNNQITRKINKCLDYYSLPHNLACPKSVDGISHPLGVFEDDGSYYRFCTLGAKRYAVDKGEDYPDEKRYSLTISGVNKKKAIPKLLERMKKEKKDFFDYFKFGFTFDRDTCGKLLHTYIDEEKSGKFIDKDGIENYYDEKSFVHLEETTYYMSANDEYISLLEGYIEIKYFG